MSEIVFDELDFTVTDLGVTDEFGKSTGRLNNDEERKDNAFHGVVACERGSYKGRAVMMKPDEKLCLGMGNDGSIEIDSTRIHRMNCLISYDDKREEYLVEPQERCSVFLNSGQPLGKNRVYCIPRGMQLILADREKVIRLG